jgi:hypothetical protein
VDSGAVKTKEGVGDNAENATEVTENKYVSSFFIGCITNAQKSYFRVPNNDKI